MHSYMLALIKPEDGANDVAVEATLYRLMAPYSEYLEVEPYEDDCWCYDIPELPDPECEDCQGTGRCITTGNPQTRYDWWVRGGRYTGILGTFEEPLDEPEIKEFCPLCNGPEELRTRERERCLYCNFSGFVSKQMVKRRNSDVVLVQAIGSDFIIPNDVLTPDGKWKSLHDLMEKGADNTWTARWRDAYDRWEPEVHALMIMYSDCLAVVVDYHI